MPNAAAVNKVHQLLDELLVDLLRRGVYGELRLTVPSQDGHIQVGEVRGHVQINKRIRT